MCIYEIYSVSKCQSLVEECNMQLTVVCLAFSHFCIDSFIHLVLCFPVKAMCVCLYAYFQKPLRVTCASKSYLAQFTMYRTQR